MELVSASFSTYTTSYKILWKHVLWQIPGALSCIIAYHNHFSNPSCTEV